MDYPSKFPPQARARVEAEKILAYREFDKQAKKVSAGLAVDALVRDCILRIFLIFAGELCAFGQENGWTVDRIDSDANEFLRTLTIEVQYDKGRGYVRMINNWGGSLTQDTERQFKQSPKWKKYENLLLGVAKIQQEQRTHLTLEQNKQQTPNASLDREGRYNLSESQLASRGEREKLKSELEHDGAKNVKVYAGVWQVVVGSRGKTIVREQNTEVLYGPAPPPELLAWLEAGKVQGPLVIEAELPPLVSQSETQEPSDYHKEIERVQAIPNDVAGILMYGRAWPHVRELAAIEKKLPYTDKPIELEAKRKELRKILLEEYPEAAEKLGLQQKPRETLATKESRSTNGLPHEKQVPTSQPVKSAPEAAGKPVQRGKFCDQVIDEIKRIKNLVVGTGRSVAEIEQEHPDFAVWKVRTSLSAGDKETFGHPNQWGAPVGYAKMLLSKTHSVSIHTINSWVKAYRKGRKTKKA